MGKPTGEVDNTMVKRYGAEGRVWQPNRMENMIGFVFQFTRIREFFIISLIIALSIIFSIASPYFLTFGNIEAIAYGMVMDGLIAVGMTIVIVSGGFDLSVGSVLALCGILVAKLLAMGINIWIAIIMGGLVPGAVMGFINGLIITKVKVNPLIATLGMMSVARGIAMVITHGTPVTGIPRSFEFLGQGRLLGFPVAVWIMLIVFILGDIFMRYSQWFRQVYYVGGNEKAARLSGIDVDMVRTGTYILTGFLAGLAGVILTSRLSAAMATAGLGAELRVIASVVIGGAKLSGGEGTVLGAILGVLLLAIINDALILFNVSVYWQSVVSGLILLAAVTLDMLSRRKREVL